MEIDIRHEPDDEKGRYYLTVDGNAAGQIQYRMTEGRRVFIHTEVDEAYEGHGLAAQLARRALDDARAEDIKIVPQCPYIRGYIERHPDDGDLVDTEFWAALRRA